MFVMNWGYHWAASGPGSPRPLAEREAAADYTASMPNKSRFVLGRTCTAWTGRTAAGRPTRRRRWSTPSARLVARHGGGPRLDPVADAWVFTYMENGVHHEAWYPDRNDRAARAACTDRGLGFGVWRLGQEDEGVWNAPILAPANWP